MRAVRTHSVARYLEGGGLDALVSLLRRKYAPLTTIPYGPDLALGWPPGSVMVTSISKESTGHCWLYDVTPYVCGAIILRRPQPTPLLQLLRQSN